MNKIIRIMIACALCAAVAAFSACAQPTEQPVVSPSSTAVSTADVSNPADEEGTETEEEIYYYPEEGTQWQTVVPDVNARVYSVNGTEVDFPTGFITDRPSAIEAGGIKLTVDAGVYVPGDVVQKTEKLINALEKASGLSFSDSKYNYCQVNVHVAKVADETTESEAGPAWAVSGDSRDLEISAGDLFLNNSYTVAHELSHTLNYSNSSKVFCQVAGEGFAQYNCYKATKLLEKADPQMAYALSPSFSSIWDMEISDPSVIYTQSMEYWMENGFPFEYAGNGPYALGFWFMTYLDEVHGDYSKWITISEDMDGDGQNFPIEQQIKAFRLAYGDDVYDGFYKWLKSNEKRLTINYDARFDYDLTGARNVSVYPFFMSFDCPTDLVTGLAAVRYSDLCVDLEETKRYLSIYKGRSLDDLVLEIQWLDGDQSIELFDADGKSLGILTEQTSVPLENVSVVFLHGEGTLGGFSVKGYTGYPEEQ